MVGVDVLAQELDLTMTLRRQVPNLRKDLVGASVDFSAAGERNDAVGARLVAPLHHRDVGLWARGPGGGIRGEHDRIVVARQADRSPLAPRLLDERPEPLQVAGAHDQVHVRRAAEDRLPRLLSHATHNPDDQLGPLVLQAPQLARPPENLAFRLFADAAGIEKDHVGLALVPRRLVPQPAEDAGHLLGVVLVHLASPGLDEVASHAVLSAHRVTRATGLRRRRRGPRPLAPLATRSPLLRAGSRSSGPSPR